MKKSSKVILFGLGASIASIYAYNKFVEKTATKKNLLSNENGAIYSWKYGDVFYTKTGSGSPVLLIHDTDSAASSVEWSKMISRLEKEHTVYAIDLLGCGRSDKPAMEYTNYLYTQLILSFMERVIQEKTVVISSNLSSSFVIMANHLDSSLFEKIVLINPVPMDQLDQIPDDISKLKKTLIDLPFIGTFLYNRMNRMERIDASFRNRYVTESQHISSTMEDTYYEAAHTGGSNGRFLFSSILGNYVNNGITHAIVSLSTPTLLIGSAEIEGYSFDLDDYQNLNDGLSIVRIQNGSLYPHLEVPEKIYTIIKEYL